MRQRSNYPDEEWAAFEWMLVMRGVLRKCRPFLARAAVKAKPHEQDPIDAKALDLKIRDLFPYEWEIGRESAA